MTYCAIMSISLIVNLPGLAITPMLGTLHEVFPGTTQMEDQLLTVLPNLLIIPFILLSGKLSTARHQTIIIVGALILFTASAVAYFFSSSMAALIVVSCLIGCGAGFLIPFSTGLIAQTFCGNYKLKQMGIQSGVANTAVMAATFAVGWLSHGNWHLPFVVYLAAVIPLILSYWLKDIPQQDRDSTGNEKNCGSTDPSSTPESRHAGNNSGSLSSKRVPTVHNGFYTGRLWALIGTYFFITFATVSISYYCPFLVEKKNWDESLTGTVTALYFLFIFLPGYTLPWFVKICKGNTFIYTAIAMTIGIGLFAFIPLPLTMCAGAALAGLGYGICQPIIYDKTSLAISSTGKATLAMSFVLAANYVGVVAPPFIIDFFRDIFGAKENTGFAFMVCTVMLAVYTLLTCIMHKSFAFSTEGYVSDSYKRS